jgi:prepilin-type N-terminal cleavage/methylation domain-containing protein
MKGDRGVTLVEVIIASVIGLIIGAAILTLYIAGQESFATGLIFLDVHGEARMSIDRIIRDTRWATQIMPASSVNQLILEIPSIDVNGDIIDIDTSYDYVIYRLTPGNQSTGARCPG